VKHRDIIEDAVNRLPCFKSYCISYVPAHTGNDDELSKNNEIVDRMAVAVLNPEVAEVMNQLTIDTNTPVDENAQPEVDADFSLEEGSMKDMLWDLADRMDRDQFIDYTATELGMDAIESAEFWDSINGDLDESTYPEYQDDLNSILNRAGVEPQNNPAPDYEAEVDSKKLSEFAPLAAAVGGALARGAVGAGAGALTRGAASIAGQVAGNAVGNALSGDDDEDELEETVSLQGQYGHSGKMQAVDSLGENIVNRLKELSGLLRTK
jgi:hypothetical protein